MCNLQSDRNLGKSASSIFSPSPLEQSTLWRERPAEEDEEGRRGDRACNENASPSSSLPLQPKLSREMHLSLAHPPTATTLRRVKFLSGPVVLDSALTLTTNW